MSSNIHKQVKLPFFVRLKMIGSKCTQICNSAFFDLVKIVLFSGFFFPEQISSNTFNSYGVSSRTQAMSNSGSAILTEAAAAYFNPAGLAAPVLPIEYITKPGKLGDDREASHQQTGLRNQITLGYSHHFAAMNIDSPNSTAATNREAKLATSNLSFGQIRAGGVFDFRNIFDTYNDLPITLGFVFSKTADDSLAAPVAYDPRRYQFQLLGANTRTIGFSLGLAAQLWRDRLSIGIGPVSQMQVKGAIDVSNINLDSNDPTRVNARTNVKTQTQAPNFGAIYRHPFNDEHQAFVSLAYRGAKSVTADLETSATLPFNFQTDVETSVFLSSAPSSVLAGLAYQYLNYTVTFDLEWQHWSKFQKIANDVAQDLAFNDVVILRGGGIIPLEFDPVKEWQLSALVGYAYSPSQTPDQVYETNILDNDKHIVSFGFSKVFAQNAFINSRTRLDLAFQWQHWATRANNKRGVYNYKGGGTQQNVDFGGNIFLTSVQVTFLFE